MLECEAWPWRLAFVGLCCPLVDNTRKCCFRSHLVERLHGSVVHDHFRTRTLLSEPHNNHKTHRLVLLGSKKLKKVWDKSGKLQGSQLSWRTALCCWSPAVILSFFLACFSCTREPNIRTGLHPGQQTCRSCPAALSTVRKQTTLRSLLDRIIWVETWHPGLNFEKWENETNLKQTGWSARV